jgi:ribosomal protein S18 acetylase RimI-like enzyme
MEFFVNTSGKIKAFDIYKDLDALNELWETCFADELARRGGDIGEELRSLRRMMPLLSVLNWFSDGFRHLLDGFVWEEQGRIVSALLIQKEGNDKTRWEIGGVATLPDYRRRGLARKLISHAMDYARSHGGQICTLYVLAENTPAYNLYRSLGFVHYDSMTEFKLEMLPKEMAQPADGYTLRPMKVSEWQARYEVTLRETPQQVQDFMPVNLSRYRLSKLQQVIIPLLMRLQNTDSHSWAVEKNGQMVGYMHLAANRTGKANHSLRLKIDPDHRAALAGPMLTLALQRLQQYPRANTLITARTACSDMLDLLKKYGFIAIETQHWLGAKLEAI